MKNYIIIFISAVTLVFAGIKLVSCDAATYLNYLWLALLAVSVLVGGDAYVELKKSKK